MEHDYSAYWKGLEQYEAVDVLAVELHQRNFDTRRALTWLLGDSKLSKVRIEHDRFARITAADDLLIEMLSATATIKMYCTSATIYSDVKKRLAMGVEERKRFPNDFCFSKDESADAVMKELIETVLEEVKLVEGDAEQLKDHEEITTQALALQVGGKSIGTGGELLTEISKAANEMYALSMSALTYLRDNS